LVGIAKISKKRQTTKVGRANMYRSLLFAFLLHGSRLTKFRTTLTYMKVGARKLKQVISTGAERSKDRQEQMPMLQVLN
jgi:hypothetical protein